MGRLKRDLHKEKVLELYKTEQNLTLVGQKVGLNKKTVRKILVENDVEIFHGLKDLHNRQFGRLKCIKVFSKDVNRKIKWMCSCECGKYKIVRAGDLLSGKIQSCGCYKAEVNSVVGKKNVGNGKYQQNPNLAFAKLFSIAFRGAISRQIEFSITLEYIVKLFTEQNGKCALSGQTLLLGSKDNRTASLDRINSKQGYIEGNVQWVHKHLNVMKLDWNQEEFVKECGKVYHYKQNQIEFNIDYYI